MLTTLFILNIIITILLIFIILFQQGNKNSIIFTNEYNSYKNFLGSKKFSSFKFKITFLLGLLFFFNSIYLNYNLKFDTNNNSQENIIFTSKNYQQYITKN